MRFLTSVFLGVYWLGCYCEIPREPSYCERIEAVACPNAQCDGRGEPTEPDCNLAQVEECVSAIEAASDCAEAGAIASSEICRSACNELE